MRARCIRLEMRHHTHTHAHTEKETHRVNDTPEVSAVNWTLQTPVLGANKPHKWIQASTCEFRGTKIVMLDFYNT